MPFFAIFPSVLRLRRKSGARSHEVLHLSPKCHEIILGNLKIWCSKTQPFWGNRLLDLQTCLIHMSLVCACHSKSIFADPLPTPHACHRFLQLPQNFQVFSHLGQGAESFALATKNPKVARACVVFAFWLRHGLRATTACTFSTS